MQTVKRKHQGHELDRRLIALVQQPIMEIDSHFLNNAVNYLRSMVDQEIAGVVGSLGSVAVDVAGTGGSGVVKFNTSTAVAFVLAAHGVDVIKFGNRSITGTSGSLDFLSAIGCLKDVNASDLERVFKSTNLLFLSAQSCYPNLAALQEERRKIGKPTIFNFIGPLLNPAQPAYRLLGISNSYMHLLINQFIKKDLLIKRVITAHSTIRTISSVTEVDELLPYASNIATLIERCASVPNQVQISILDIPELVRFDAPDSGLESSQSAISRFQTEPLSAVNARTFMSIINGDDNRSIHFEGIALNAGAAFLAAGAVGNLDEGITLTKTLIANKSVARKLDQVRRVLS